MERQMDMENRRYIVAVQPYLFSFMDIITGNMAGDVETLKEFEVVSLAQLKRNDTLPLGLCVSIRRVI